ncbi:MAG: PQQ-binding-like beta-propeller repeat protein, partial [Verrucomicrobiota bacterium]
MKQLPPPFRVSRLLFFVNILTMSWFAGILCGERAGAVSIWPQFRGPNSQGVDDSGQPPVAFGPETNLLWKVQVPSGVSSPCLWGNHIFLTAHEAGKLSTLCIDRRDGKILWRMPAPTDKVEEVHKTSNPASATPVTDGKRVYVYFASFGLIAYDYNGREQWKKPLPVPFVVNGSGTSPALCNGRLILNCDQQGGKSVLLALEPRNGKTLWQTPRPDFPSGYTTPVWWKHDGAEEIVVVGSLRVVGYGLTDGKERWSARGLEAVSVCPTPALGDGQLYVMSRSLGEGGSKLPAFPGLLGLMDKNGDGKIAIEEAVGPLRQNGAFEFIDRDRDGFVTAAEWTESEKFISKGESGIFALRAPGTGDVTETHVAWKQKRAVASVSSPLF